jgi:hypothetical protein
VEFVERFNQLFDAEQRIQEAERGMNSALHTFFGKLRCGPWSRRCAAVRVA